MFNLLPYSDENRSDIFEALVFSSKDTTDIDQMLALNLQNLAPYPCFHIDLILHLFNTYDFLDIHFQPYLSQLMQTVVDYLTMLSLDRWIEQAPDEALSLIGVKQFIIDSAIFEDETGKINEVGVKLKGICEKLFQSVKESKNYVKIS